MFSNIGKYISLISSLVAGNVQTTVTGILQLVLPSIPVIANAPAAVTAAISTFFSFVITWAMDKNHKPTQIWAAGVYLFTILQWVGVFFPESNLPLHTAYAAIMGGFMALMKAEGVQLPASSN